MFERILIPTDFSWYAQKTLFCVPEIPGAGVVVLLHVTDDAAERSTWHTLAEVKSAASAPAHALAYAGEFLEKKGISVIYEIVPPEEKGAHAAILASAERHRADLILIGGHGRGFLKDMIMGSTSQKVVEEANVHVLVTHFREQPPKQENEVPVSIPGSQEHLFSRVLVPVDFSRPTYETIEFVGEMGGYREMIPFHVIDTVEDRKDLHAKLADSMQKLAFLKRDLESGAGKITPLIRFGDPADEICRMAEEEQATLILLSRFGASDYTKNARIGSIAVKVAKNARIPVLIRYPSFTLDVQARELTQKEFPLAERVWSHYRQQKVDPSRDRIFGVFVEGELVSAARCRRYPDCAELDGLFTLEEFRGKGYARRCTALLVRECGTEPLFTFSTKETISFFRSFGFSEIGEKDIPQSIQERYRFAMGDLAAANLYPMSRGA